MTQKQFPATIDVAVDVVIATLSDDDQRKTAAMAESDLIGLHPGFGDVDSEQSRAVAMQRRVDTGNRGA